MKNLTKHSSDLFSIATLFHSRLRRVTSRVIDVMYFIDNKEYAQYILDLASKANDTELDKYIERLYGLLALNSTDELAKVVIKNTQQYDVLDQHTEVTEEEIYRAQVSHHYIGALR